jgi:ParB family chromosome partitioning protein
MLDEKKKPEARKRGLGRGLSALFEDDEDQFAPPRQTSVSADDQLSTGAARRTVGIDQIEPWLEQPRQYIEEEALAELAESVATHGILQPILVRSKPGSEGRFEIIAGERRWRAAQKARLHEVPVIVKTLTDVQALEIALIENLQRADLNPLEEAIGFARLMKEFGHTQEKLAASLGKSRSYLANTLRLLALPGSVQLLVRQGKLTAGHARALVTAKDPDALAKIVLDRNLSVRATEKLAAEEEGRPARAAKGVKAGKDIDTLALEKHMTEILGLKVSIDMNGAGKGSIRIDVKSLDQLDDVMRRLSQVPFSR